MSCIETIDAGNPVLAGLLAELAALKEDRRRTDSRISEVERLILQNVESKDEGSITEQAGDFKLSVTFKLNRKLDESIWARIRNDIPTNLHPVRYKPEVDTKGVRWLQNNEPELYRVLAEALTVKPAKPYIKLEPVENV